MKIYVTSSSNKLAILRENPLEERKFYTFSAFVSLLFGSVSDSKLFALYSHFNLTPRYFLNLLRLLPYIDLNKSYSTDILLLAKEIKSLAVKYNYYDTNSYFLDSLREQELIFFDVEPSKELVFLFQYLDSNKIQYQKVFANASNSTPSCYSFLDQNKELDGIFSLIKQLKLEGASLNNVYLGFNSDYTNLLDFYLTAYDLKLKVDKNVSLLAASEVKQFLETGSLDNIQDEVILSKLIPLLNRYHLTLQLRKSDLELLKYFLTRTYFDEVRFEEEIQTFNPSAFIAPNAHVFILGAVTSFPSFKPSFSFLDQASLRELGFISDEQENDLYYSYLFNKLKTISNLTFSFPTTYFGSEAHLSALVSELQIPVSTLQRVFGLSCLSDSYQFADALDLFYKYNQKSDLLKTYDLSKLTYNTYSNQYNGSLPYLDKFNLSYTHLSAFLECRFKYYLAYVLGLDEFKSSLSGELGTYVHKMLEESVKPNFNFSELSDWYLQDMESKVRFFAGFYEEVLPLVFAFNELFFKNFKFQANLTEERVLVDFADFIFKGSIDRTVYLEHKGKVDLAIIDYKTGDTKLELKDLYHFANLQLLCYLYLIQNYEPFSDKKLNILGLYLEKLELKERYSNEEFLKKLRLVGFSNVNLLSDRKLLEVAQDYTTLKINKNGSLKANTIDFSLELMQEATSYIENLIKEVGRAIKAGDFKIDPKDTPEIKSCTYCKFRHICYVTDRDIERR